MLLPLGGAKSAITSGATSLSTWDDNVTLPSFFHTNKLKKVKRR